VTAHIRRIEAVEKDLKALGAGSATKEDVSRVRAEVKKLYDGLHVGEKCSVFADREVLTDFFPEFLDLRAHVWGIRE
jgi:hypothetical protein